MVYRVYNCVYYCMCIYMLQMANQLSVLSTQLSVIDKQFFICLPYGPNAEVAAPRVSNFLLGGVR
jgi:hypothetical protein